MTFVVVFSIEPIEGKTTRHAISSKFPSDEKAVKWMNQNMTKIGWNVMGLIKKHPGLIRSVAIEVIKQ